MYSASVSMPAMDFRRDLKAISGLSVVLVVISAVALGYLFSLLVRGSAWPRASRSAPSSAPPTQSRRRS
ncbi:hypothetical protein NKG05_13300 [Oerskovia sp. M15]